MAYLMSKPSLLKNSSDTIAGGIRGFIHFSKSISLEFQLYCFEIVVQHFNHYVTTTPHSPIVFSNGGPGHMLLHSNSDK